MIKLIFHNVLKHRFLNILIGALIMLLCFYLIVGLNMVFSIAQSLRKAVAENMTGDLIIASSKAERIDIMTKDGERKVIPLERADELTAFLRSKDYVDVAAPRLRVLGFLQSEFNIMPIILTGVDPAVEPNLLPNRVIEEGHWLSSPNQIVLYYRHSDYLHATLGDNLGISINTVDGYQNFDTANLVGIVDYKDLSYYTDFSFFGFLTIDYLNSIIQNPDKIVGEIFVRLKHSSDVERLKKEIVDKMGNGYRFIAPQESASFINGVYMLTHITVYFIAFILLVMVFLCSSFIVSLSIETRRQEIGIYQSLGVVNRRIGLLFGGEFAVIMILFGVIGSSLGLYVMNSIGSQGIEASIIPLQLIFGRSVLHIKNQPETFFIVLCILLVAFMGNVLNAILKLSKLDPIEVMKDL